MTVGFLVFGVVNVTQAVATSHDLQSVLDGVFMQEGYGHYQPAAAASAAGWIIAAADVLCLVLAIGFSVPRLRDRRTAFWIPLVCAAIGLVVTAAVTLGAAVADPAFLARALRG